MFIDTARDGGYSAAVRETPVRRIHWTLLFCLLGMVIFLAVPPADMPETAFNEMDLPLTLSHVVLPRVTLSPPSLETVALPNLAARPEALETGDLVLQPEPLVKSHHGPSLQLLLCTFLI